jgi:carboxylesterase
LAPLLSLLDAADGVGAKLANISCPVLLLSSRDDHVVPPANGDTIAAALGDRCERVWMERSFHVSTLDYDRDEIEKRATEFVSRVTGSDG